MRGSFPARFPGVSGAMLLLSACVLLQHAALAHPVAQGRMDVTIHETKIEVQVLAALEEVCVSNALWVNSKDEYVIGAEHVASHGAYLLQHVQLFADGVRLNGRLLSSAPPDAARKPLSPLAIQTEYATLRFEFTLPPGAKPPAVVMFKQDVLNEVAYAPGNPWQATYVMVIGQTERAPIEGLLLTSLQPLVFPCDWTPAPATLTTPPANPAQPAASTQPPARPAPVTDSGATARQFIHEGFFHILHGYDHLLFVAALVLAARGFWDLFKVVTAFTLSHSLTLALSVLNIVRLDSAIVEPLIAASIVVVALQNVFFPQQSHGWSRLAAAFFFGLFHGLGFAGGCLEAMEGMQLRTTVVAILAFSLGVELGHQAVVLPLFGALTAVRRTRPHESGVDVFNRGVLRYGSMLIACAGLFYLVNALGWLGTLSH